MHILTSLFLLSSRQGLTISVRVRCKTLEVREPRSRWVACIAVTMGEVLQPDYRRQAVSRINKIKFKYSIYFVLEAEVFCQDQFARHLKWREVRRWFSYQNVQVASVLWCFIFSCTVGMGYPDPEIFIMVVDLAQAKLEECVNFDDRIMKAHASKELC